MLKHTKLLALVLAVCLIVAMFAGCNNNTSASTTTAAAANSTTKAATTTKAAATTTAAAVEKPTEIRLWMGTAGIAMPDDVAYDDNPYINKVQELANVEFTEVIVPAYADFATQVTLMLASGDICDFTHCWQPADINEAGEDGAFMEMYDTVKGSALLSSRYSDQQLELMKHTDGGLYFVRTIPGFDPTALNIRMDIVGQYTDGKVPTTLDEYFDIAKQAKADGKITYAFWEAGNYLYFVNSIFNLYGTQASGWQYYGANGGEWMPAVENPTYVEALNFLRNCYVEGLINPAFVTVDGATANGSMYYDNVFWKHNNLGSTMACVSSVYDPATDLNGQDPADIDWIITPFPKAVTNNYVEPFNAEMSRPAAMAGHGFAIWSDTKEVDACVRLLETWVSDDVADLTSSGIEGLDYEVVDGEKVFADDIADRTYKLMYGMGWTYYSTKHLAGNIRTWGAKVPEDLRAEHSKHVEDMMNNMLDIANEQPAVTPGTILTITDDAVKTKAGNINEEASSLVMKAIVGDLTIDDAMAQLKALYETATDVTDAYNEAFDAKRAQYGF